MKILISGTFGQLGFKIQELLSQNHELILTDRDNLDITNQKAVADFVEKKVPDVIIHAAAYTQVDQAESEVDLCRSINVDGTYHLARAAKKIDALIFYLSTDYVFDGKKHSPYLETDKPHPLSIYGETKYAGEKIIREENNNFYILRTSWLFGETFPNRSGSNFVQKILQLAQSRDQLTVVHDQIGSPTYTKDLVEMIDLFISQYNSDQLITSGLYHFSGQGECSWYDFAKEILDLKSIKIDLQKVNSDQFPQKATRPKYSYLSKEKIEKSSGVKVRKWQEMLAEYLTEK